MNKQNETLECCPPFNPEPWDNKNHVWKEKKFICGKVKTFFFMPLNFGRVMRRLDAQVRSAGAQVPDWLCLSEHTSSMNMNLWLAVDKNVPDAENNMLSGTFYTKVYEGKFSEIGKMHKNFGQTLIENKLKKKRDFIWYTTCPKCAKKYGKNYMVFVAETE